MTDFSYHNIFETKGIEYIITIVFFGMLIPFWMLLNRKVKEKESIPAIRGILSSALVRIPKGLFLSRNHTWAFLDRTGKVKIGLDDLLVHLTGKLEVNHLKLQGDTVNKGDLLAEIIQKGKKLNILSPVSGKIIQPNSSLIEFPEKLEDAYGEGWLFEIEPSNWLVETQSFFIADKAINWLITEMDRFKDFINITTQKYAPQTEQYVMQDGGELLDFTLSDLPSEIWSEFQIEFLNKTS